MIRKLLNLTTAPNKAAGALSVLFEGLAKQTFRDKRTPEGEPWAPAKDGHPNLLVRSGAMRGGVVGIARRASVMLEARDWKSRFHLLPYFRRKPRARDNRGRFLPGAQAQGPLIRPARRFLPLKGKMPVSWKTKGLALVIALRAVWWGR